MGVYCERLAHLDELSGARSGVRLNVVAFNSQDEKHQIALYVTTQQERSKQSTWPRGVGAAVHVIRGSQPWQASSGTNRRPASGQSP